MTEIRREESRVPFWAVIGGSLAVSAAGFVFTTVGLTRVLREEEPIQLPETTRGK